MGGQDPNDDDSDSGTEEAGVRNMALLSEEDKNSNAEGDDVDFPSLPPTEESLFEERMKTMRKIMLKPEL